MKANIGYNFSRILYGLFLIWYGINMIDPHYRTINKTFIERTFRNIKNTTIYNVFANNTLNYDKNIEKLNQSSNNICLLMSYLLIIGGIFCMCGYSVSIYFIMCGLLIDFCLIHNIYYFRDEQVKVNTIRVLALIGGAYFVV